MKVKACLHPVSMSDRKCMGLYHGCNRGYTMAVTEAISWLYQRLYHGCNRGYIMAVTEAIS